MILRWSVSKYLFFMHQPSTWKKQTLNTVCWVTSLQTLSALARLVTVTNPKHQEHLNQQDVKPDLLIYLHQGESFLSTWWQQYHSSAITRSYTRGLPYIFQMKSEKSSFTNLNISVINWSIYFLLEQGNREACNKSQAWKHLSFLPKEERNFLPEIFLGFLC